MDARFGNPALLILCILFRAGRTQNKESKIGTRLTGLSEIKMFN